MSLTADQKAEGEKLCAGVALPGGLLAPGHPTALGTWAVAPQHCPHGVEQYHPTVRADGGDYPYGATVCCRCRKVLDGTICGPAAGAHDEEGY